jgi:guanylate kinase
MGKLYVVMGRSAVGKSTIERLLEKSGEFRRIVSYTSRAKRDGEVDGIDYNYVSKEKFADMLASDEFLEHAEYNGWFYGVTKNSVDLSKGNYLLVAECEGFKEIREKLGRDNVVGIYLYLSDYWELLKRSIDRQPHATYAQCMEMCRRFISDAVTFAEVEKLATLKINNVDSNQTVSIIKRFARHE